MPEAAYPMALLPQFELSSSGTLGQRFREYGCFTFHDAARYVQELPYGRNNDKTRLSGVFNDRCGTCSTKHALVKALADEHGMDGLKLVIGIFRMHAHNTPAVKNTLAAHQLACIPEAHCYLKANGHIVDLTWKSSREPAFVAELLEEQEIAPDQITDFKVSYHKQFLNWWLQQEPQPGLELEALWMIREQCIRDLSVL